MDKNIITKVFEEVLSKHHIQSKCSKKDLTREDKELIEDFINSDEKWLNDRENHNDEVWEALEESQSKHKYTELQNGAVTQWSHSAYSTINGKCYNTESYRDSVKKGYVNEDVVVKTIKNLQSAIDDGVRVPFNVVTHRIGHWDKGHKAGDVIIQKGFASTGLNGGTNVSSDDPYEITYYIPTGSKGVLLTPKSFTGTYGGGSERELLLGQGTRQYVLRQDDEDKTVEVLVLPDR